MKKSLFATTAIVAAFGMGATAANAQDASLDISAFSNFYAAWADQDMPAGGYHQSDYDFSTNTEFRVEGEVTLDNGITAGMMVQVEADNNDGNGAVDNIDENIVYVEGSFGRVELGHEDGASDTMRYGATSVKAVYVGTFNNTTGSLINYAGNPIGGAVLTGFGDSGDATKINYFTPRFAGLQLGITHAPDGNADAVIPARGATETTDHWEAGINYVNSFNGFDVAASVTGTYFNSTSSTTVNVSSTNTQTVTFGGTTFTVPTITTTQNAGGDNYNVSPGFVLGYGGFEFGASAGFGEIAGQDTEAYDAGIGYSTGPWSVSLTGIYAERDVAGGNDDNIYEVNTGLSYALGSGVNVFASGAYGEVNPAGNLPNGNSNNNEYVSLLSGVGVSF